MNEFEERNNINESGFGFNEDKSIFSQGETTRSEENYSFENKDFVSVNPDMEDRNMTVMEEEEYKKPEVKIDLNGGYGSQSQGCSGYRENVGNKREKRQNIKFVSVIAALTAINFVFVLGAFFVGRTFGNTNRSVVSKQELIETMQAPSSDSGAVNAANVKGEMPT